MEKERCLKVVVGTAISDVKKDSLSSSFRSVLVRNMGERKCYLSTPLYSAQKHCGMTNGVEYGMTNRVGGFTLIELLVVVLIIGILAAVAVPQYQKTVWKSRAAQLYTDAKALYEAQQAYHMANNAYATTFDELAVEPSLNGSCDGKLENYGNATDCRAGKYSMVFLSSGTIFAIFHQGPYYHGGFRARGNTFYCYEHTVSKFCALMGYNTLYSQSGSNYYYSK